MSPLELYEATRGVWSVGRPREEVRYALAVFEGVVREVYHVERWDPARAASYKTRSLSLRELRDRWEFTGKVADTGIRSQYRGRSVQDYWKKGARNPFRYVNV